MTANALTDWLLESPTPSIRYLTRCHLLDRPDDDPDTRAARADIMQTGPVPAILARQTPEGHWEGERSYYTPKYTSTHWSMTLLMEFAADPADPRLQRGADFMLSATERRVINALAPEQQDWGCFWATRCATSRTAGGRTIRGRPLVEDRWRQARRAGAAV
jgi:hypothetical protein